MTDPGHAARDILTVIAYSFPALCALGLAWLGAWHRRRFEARDSTRWMRRTLGMLALLAITTAAWAVHDPAEGVGTQGVLIGAALWAGSGFVLSAIYYLGGRLAARRRAWIGLCWAISVVPLYIVLFGLILGFAAQISCEPDQYECPL